MAIANLSLETTVGDLLQYLETPCTTLFEQTIEPPRAGIWNDTVIHGDITSIFYNLAINYRCIYLSSQGEWKLAQHGNTSSPSLPCPETQFLDAPNLHYW